jgi:hypothetical protein
MNAAQLDDLEREAEPQIARYRQNLVLARDAAARLASLEDGTPAKAEAKAELAGRLEQASAALTRAAQITAAAQGAATPPAPSRWSTGLNYGGATGAHGVLSGPQGR